MAADTFPELQALADRLEAKPPRKLPASQRLTVYGYVRSDERRPVYADACADLLIRWSVTEGWRLGTVFRDVGVGAETLVRPGFSGLLDVLRLPGSVGALVVDAAHVSSSTSVAQRLTLAVRGTGTTVLVLADELREGAR
jgi:hypothetical protein